MPLGFQGRDVACNVSTSGAYNFASKNYFSDLGGGTPRERDRSGTTRNSHKMAVRVMERIARPREAGARPKEFCFAKF
jgi:hypothetical protein